MQIEHRFDEIPFIIGTDGKLQPQSIAFITGVATITFHPNHSDDMGDGYEWEIDRIVLDSPVAGCDPVAIDHTTLLYHLISNSIIDACENNIVEAIHEEAAA